MTNEVDGVAIFGFEVPDHVALFTTTNPSPLPVGKEGDVEGESEGEQLTMHNEEGWRHDVR